MSNTRITPNAVAWDIETCPMPLSTLTDRQRRRLKKEYAEKSRRKPKNSVTENVRRAMSFHGFLCWICCVSMAWRGDEGDIQTVTKAGAKPVEEAQILRWVWKNVSMEHKNRQGVRWVTFNGKKFDVRILRTRSLRHEVQITNENLLDEYPYSYKPHCDVAALWRNDWTGLEDVADLFGINYQSKIDGSEVAKSISEGKIDLVEQHCEADVKTTLRIYEHVLNVNPEIR